MTGPHLPPRAQALVEQISRGDRSVALALHALISAADERGCADFNRAAIVYRDDHLAALRASGRDAEREAGRLSLDEVREHLARSVLPRLASEGAIILPATGLAAPDAKVQIAEALWRDIGASRADVASALRQTGEHVSRAPETRAAAGASTLEASGLVKVYRRRKVVNDVALRLQQGEIVGLLGPRRESGCGHGRFGFSTMGAGRTRPVSALAFVVSVLGF